MRDPGTAGNNSARRAANSQKRYEAIRKVQHFKTGVGFSKGSGVCRMACFTPWNALGGGGGGLYFGEKFLGETTWVKK